MQFMSIIYLPINHSNLIEAEDLILILDDNLVHLILF